MLQYRLGNRRAFHLRRVVLLAFRAFVNHLVIINYLELCRDPLYFRTDMLLTYRNQLTAASVAVPLVFRQFTDLFFVGNIFQYLIPGSALPALVGLYLDCVIRVQVRLFCFRGCFLFRFVKQWLFLEPIRHGLFRLAAKAGGTGHGCCLPVQFNRLFQFVNLFRHLLQFFCLFLYNLVLCFQQLVRGHRHTVPVFKLPLLYTTKTAL